MVIIDQRGKQKNKLVLLVELIHRDIHLLSDLNHYQGMKTLDLNDVNTQIYVMEVVRLCLLKFQAGLVQNMEDWQLLNQIEPTVEYIVWK